MSEMTATRMRLFAWAATITLLAVGWLLAARGLWRTDVPGDLNLPELGVRDYFTSRELRRAERYERFFLVAWPLSVAASLVVLFAMTRRGPRLAREIGIGRVGTGIVLGVVTVTVLWAVAAPLALAVEWWQHRYGLSYVGYGETLGYVWGGLLGEVLLAAFLIAVVMGLAGRLRRFWWVVGGPLFVALVAGLTYVAPILIVEDKALRKPALVEDVRELARRTGASGTPVRVEEVHEETPQANAYALGIGSTEKVVLWDTLLDGRFPRREIDVVIAHEFGHIARKHLWKGIGWFALFTLPTLVLLTELTRRRGGLQAPAVIPLAILILTVFQVVTAPGVNLVSRRYEAEADWTALQATRDPAAARGLFKHFATINVGDPSPPTWAYVMLDTHPTLIQRIAMANAWASRERAAGRIP